MTHYSSAFLKPPVPLMAHLNIHSIYPIVLICLRERTRKGYIPAFSFVLKETPLLPGGAGKQMVKVRPQDLLIPDSEGRWRVQGAGENTHSILDLGLEATSFFLSLQPSQEGTGVMSTFWASSQTQVPVLHTGTSEAKGAIPSSAHPSFLVSISQNIHRRPCLI